MNPVQIVCEVQNFEKSKMLSAVLGLGSISCGLVSNVSH